MDSSTLALDWPADDQAAEVELAKKRDRVVWTRWYESYHELLYRYAYARLGTREEAEDVAAQVFVRALHAIGRYSYRGRPVLGWLYRIAHNLVSDRLRQKSREPVTSEAAATVAAPDGLAAELDAIELRRVLQRLKREQREVLILRFLLSLPTREVARLTGKSEAAVHSLQVRGVEALRRHLGA